MVSTNPGHWSVALEKSKAILEAVKPNLRSQTQRTALSSFLECPPLMLFERLLEKAEELHRMLQDERAEIEHLNEQFSRVSALAEKAEKELAAQKRVAVDEADGGTDWKDSRDAARETLRELDQALVSCREKIEAVREAIRDRVEHELGEMLRGMSSDRHGLSGIVLSLADLVEEVVDLRDDLGEYEDVEENAVHLLALISTVANWLEDNTGSLWGEITVLDGAIRDILKGLARDHYAAVGMTLDYGDVARNTKSLLLNLPTPDADH